MKLFLICFIVFELVHGRSTPDYFPQCSRKDPQIEECILKGVEAVRPRLKDGISEINLPPLEPFKMDLLNVDSSLTGATIKATVKNLVAHGGSDFIIDYLKIDLDNKYAADLQLTIPFLDVEANYNTRGSRMLLFYITGNGTFKGSFTNVTVKANCVASSVKKNEVDYFQLDSVTTMVVIGSGELEINPAQFSLTGRAVSSFVSSSPSLILKIIKPIIDETTAQVVFKYLSDVLANVPIKDVLTD